MGYTRPYRGRMAAATVASAVAAAAAALYAYLVGPLVEGVLLGGSVTLGPWTLVGTDLLWKLPLGVLAIASVKALCQWLHGGLMLDTGQRVVADLRQELYGHLLAQPPRFFEERHSGELLSRFTADVAQVEYSVAQALSSYVKDSLQVLALLATCLGIDARLFLLAFVVLPGAVLPVSRFARSLKRVATRTQSSLGRLTELAAEQLHNLPVLQAYRAEGRAGARFDDEQATYLAAMRRSLFIRGAFTPTLEVLGVAGVALAIGAGAAAVRSEPALAKKLLSFLTSALLMYQPLKALSGTLALVMQGVGAAERLFEVVDAYPCDRDDAGGPKRADPLSRALTLLGVRCAWADGRPVLDGVALEVPAGKRVALVGPSGSGKSTVFSLLLGFLKPQGGQLLWDGEPLESFQRASLRAQLAWVPQEPVLFSGTVRHNLLLGRPEATDDELWEALGRAHAAAFVRALPRGLDEEVGERGGLLSGGQRQRLAIARAFLRRPSVLLLDEPTSALDARSEQEVQAGLAELMAGRTVVVIAHRLATVREADVIYVLDGGRVVERGDHAGLLAQRGRYAQLLEALEAGRPGAAAGP